MNNKGFMMAEVVVVASIILVTLVGLYTSYNKIFSIYNQRIDYYDVATLYELANVRETKDLNVASMTAIVDTTYEKVYFLKKSDLTNLKNKNIHLKLKDYIDYLKDSTTFNTEYILIMERCLNSDINNCKYAYLEVYD